MKIPIIVLLPALIGYFLGIPGPVKAPGAALAAIQPPSSTSAASTSAPIRMALEPMAAPRPALRYTLVHETIDQMPGNAALAYQQVARLITQNEKWRDQGEQIQEWLKLPIDQMPIEAVEELVFSHASNLDRFAKATLHERCDFEIPIRQEGVNALLPHLAEMRGISRLLAIEIRLRIRQGRYLEAIDRLKAGFTLARHTGNGTTLIEGLVGLAIANVMLDRVEELAARPGAPNLYWALSDLPPAFLNLWSATRWERCFLYVHMPVLWEARKRPVEAADLRQLVREFRRFGGSGTFLPWLPEEDSAILVTAAAGLAAYPKAIEHLERQGRSRQDIRQMPVADALAGYIGESYATQRDDLFKWFAMPYHEARDGMARAEAGLQEARRQDPIGSILPSMLLPALTRAASRYATVERRVAMLRCVEAIRLHAAGHGRRLPASLDQIQDVPIPRDPMTGVRFLYRLEGNTAILEGPTLPDRDQRNSKIYELSIRP